jgi:hypothetical protein
MSNVERYLTVKWSPFDRRTLPVRQSVIVTVLVFPTMLVHSCMAYTSKHDNGEQFGVTVSSPCHVLAVTFILRLFTSLHLAESARRRK